MITSSDLRKRLAPLVASELREWSRINDRALSNSTAYDLGVQITDSFFGNVIPELSRGNIQVDPKTSAKFLERIISKKELDRFRTRCFKRLSPIIFEMSDEIDSETETEALRLATVVAALVNDEAQAFFLAAGNNDRTNDLDKSASFEALRNIDKRLARSTLPHVALEVDRTERFTISPYGGGPLSAVSINYDDLHRQLLAANALFAQRGNVHPRLDRLLTRVTEAAEIGRKQGRFLPLCYSTLAIEAELRAKDSSPADDERNPPLDAELRAELNLLNLTARLLAMGDPQVRAALEGLDKYAQALRPIDVVLSSAIEPLLDAFVNSPNIFNEQTQTVNKTLFDIADARQRLARVEKVPTISDVGSEAGWTHAVLYSFGRYVVAAATAGVVGNLAYDQLPILLKSLYAFVELNKAPLGLVAADFPHMLGWITQLVEYVQNRARANNEAQSK
jgi:hypothetical protein